MTSHRLMNHPFMGELRNLIAKYQGLPQDVKRLSVEMILGAENTGYIYCIVCTANSRSYVGQTRSLWDRVQGHLVAVSQEIYSKVHSKSILWELNFAKYGISHYRVEVLETPEVKELGEREKYWQTQKRALLSCQETHRLINETLKKRGEKVHSFKLYDGSRKDWENTRIQLTLNQLAIVEEIVQAYGHIDQPCHSDGIPLEWFARAENYELNF